MRQPCMATTALPQAPQGACLQAQRGELLQLGRHGRQTRVAHSLALLQVQAAGQQGEWAMHKEVSIALLLLKSPIKQEPAWPNSQHSVAPEQYGAAPQAQR